MLLVISINDKIHPTKNHIPKILYGHLSQSLRMDMDGSDSMNWLMGTSRGNPHNFLVAGSLTSQFLVEIFPNPLIIIDPLFMHSSVVEGTISDG